MVGSGLAGAAAAATLGELGYRVKLFTFHDSPRRAHSIAAQGGINAAKNYPNDGDSVYRLFYDTVKGGDFRAREGNVYRLAEVSVNIIDQCVAQGVPVRREYGGLLDNRSFGGAQVSRTFYARGQTGQQLLLGAYQALAHQVGRGTVELHTRTEMLDLVVKDGRAAGIVTRDLTTGAIQSWSAHAVALCTGGYGNAYYLSTNAKASNVTAAWRAHKQGALFANPCFTQIHPTCIPRSDDFQSKLTLMSESLRNDGRVWIPKELDDTRSPDQIPDDDRDYFLERRYPAFGNLVPRDVASRAIKTVVDAGPRRRAAEERRVPRLRASRSSGSGTTSSRSATATSSRCTSASPTRTRTRCPMRIYPAIHYTMGGLWVDYDLMSNVPGLYVLGEANFADQGANRLGAERADAGPGRRLLRAAVDDRRLPGAAARHPAGADRRPRVQGPRRPTVADQTRRLLSVNGNTSVDHFHRELGKILWDNCGMARSQQSLEKALAEIPALRERVLRRRPRARERDTLNQSLEKAAASPTSSSSASCSASTPSRARNLRRPPPGRAPDRGRRGAARRRALLVRRRLGVEGRRSEPELHKEPLEFEYVHLAQRSYK